MTSDPFEDAMRVVVSAVRERDAETDAEQRKEAEARAALRRQWETALDALRAACAAAERLLEPIAMTLTVEPMTMLSHHSVADVMGVRVLRQGQFTGYFVVITLMTDRSQAVMLHGPYPSAEFVLPPVDLCRESDYRRLLTDFLPSIARELPPLARRGLE